MGFFYHLVPNTTEMSLRLGHCFPLKVLIVNLMPEIRYSKRHSFRLLAALEAPCTVLFVRQTTPR